MIHSLVGIFLRGRGRALRYPFNRFMFIALSCLIAGSLHAAEVTDVFRGDDYGTGLSAPNPRAMAVDSKGNLFFAVTTPVAIMRVWPAGLIDVVAPVFRSGTRTLTHGNFMRIDSADNLYIAGELSRIPVLEQTSYAVFKISPLGEVTELLNYTVGTDGIGIRAISGMEVDHDGNVYLSGYVSNNLIKIDVDGGVSELLAGPLLQGAIPFSNPRELVFDSAKNLYIAATGSSNVLRFEPSGEIQEFTFENFENPGFGSPSSLVINQYDEVLVSSVGPYNGAVIIYPDGNIAKVIDPSGDGTGVVTQYGSWGHVDHGLEFVGEPLIGPRGNTAGPDGSFYVAGFYSDNLFRVGRDGAVTALMGRTVTPDFPLKRPQFLMATPANEIFISGTADNKLIRLTLEELEGETPFVSITDTYNEFPNYSSNPIFRFYNTRDNAFFYTDSADEAQMITAYSSPTYTGGERWPYIYQGSTFRSAHSYPDSVPLHRFYNYKTGHHFFTVSDSESDFVLRQIRDNDWPFNYEGSGFRVYLSDPTPDRQGVETPVFRFYSHVFNRHFFTASNAEVISLLRDRNWEYEGVGFYAEAH
jgi:hypothetical protein